MSERELPACPQKERKKEPYKEERGRAISAKAFLQWCRCVVARSIFSDFLSIFLSGSVCLSVGLIETDLLSALISFPAEVPTNRRPHTRSDWQVWLLAL